MKNILALVLGALSLISNYCQGQSWNVGGNTVGAVKNFGTVDNYDLPFVTFNTEYMRLKANGNLLLGTTTDNGYKLQVNGNQNLLGNVLDMGNYSSVYSVNLLNGVHGSSGFYIYQVSKTWLRAGLDFNSDLNQVNIYSPINGGNKAIILDGNTTDIYMNTWQSGAMIQQFTLKGATGFFGLGTNAPTQRLTVAGNALANQFMLNSLTTPSPGAGIFAPLASTFAVYTNSTEQMRVDVNGHVGIGTTSITDVNYKLFVETGIKTRKVRVDQLTWSDYVFDKNYQLPSLDELETYIHKYRHLPGIASAEEVKKDGIDLGSSQAALLKKIEELTLYLIQENLQVADQNKRLACQEQEIVELKKEAVQSQDQKKRLNTLEDEMQELKRIITK